MRNLAYYLRKLVRWTVLVTVAVLGWKVVPVYGSALRFKFAVSEACKTGATARHAPDLIQDDILFKARQLDLPVKPEDVEIRMQDRIVQARVAYQVPVELGPRKVVLNFHANAEEAPLFISVEGQGDEQMKKLLEQD